MTDTSTPFGRAMTLAAVSGLRAALGPAFLETSRRGATGRNWILGSIGEMVIAKFGVFPRGYHPLILIPHSLAGAWVACESMRDDGTTDDRLAPIAGAVVAAGVASVAPIARITLTKGLGMSETLVGLAEDYLALKLGAEATGMSFGQIGEAARHAVEEFRDQFAPDLEVPNLSSPSCESV